MQSTPISNAQRRSISEALETWTEAEKNNHSVAADSSAQILYVNTDLHKSSGGTKEKKLRP